MSSPPPQPAITPASLFSLAIYNPSLGATDSTVNDQIVFHTSRTPQTPNEKLRQIGLAQGVVEFSRGFTKCENLSNVETEKSRIVLKEVEQGWWALAYINYTRITSGGEPEHTEYSSREVSQPQLLLAQLASAYQQYRFHYGTFSENIATLGREEFCKRMDRYWMRWAWNWDIVLSGNPAIDVWNGTKIAQPRLGATVREVLEAIVRQEQAVEGGGLVDMVVGRYGKVEELPQDQSKDHSKDGGLSALNAQLEPPRASSGLGFLWPTSAGESESSSRNQSPARPPSLLPLPSPRLDKTAAKDLGPKDLTPQDGCIFLGTGKLHPQSVRDIAVWAANIYRYGSDNPGRLGKKKKGTKRPRGQRFGSSPNVMGGGSLSGPSSAEPSPLVERGRPGSADASPLIPNSSPTPIVRQRPQSLIAAHRTPLEVRERSTSAASQSRRTTTAAAAAGVAGSTPVAAGGASAASSNGKLLSILTFGWAGGAPSPSRGGKDPAAQNPVITETNVESRSQPGSPRVSMGERRVSAAAKRVSTGPRFLYGFLGDLDGDDGEEGLQIEGVEAGVGGEGGGGRITQRSVWLYELEKEGSEGVGGGGGGDGEVVKSKDFGQAGSTTAKAQGKPALQLKEYRMIVYLDKPLTYILIFRKDTPRLLTPSLYRSLHLRLHPLRPSLLPSQASTPSKPRARAATTSKPVVYDLMFDPETLVISSSIPCIPGFVGGVGGGGGGAGGDVGWTRTDAVHVHNQVLNIFADGEREKERKSRTTRGWWVAWSRVGRGGKEAVLVWKGGERGGGAGGLGGLAGKEGSVPGVGDLGGDIAGGVNGGGGGSGGGGILDTRRYFEGLLRGRG